MGRSRGNSGKLSLSLGRATQVHEGDTQLVMGVGVGGLDPEHLLEAGDRFFEASFALIEDTQVVLGIGKVGIEVGGVAEENHRRLQGALFISCQPQVIHTDSLLVAGDISWLTGLAGLTGLANCILCLNRRECGRQHCQTKAKGKRD